MSSIVKGQKCESGWTGDRCGRPLFHPGPHDNERWPPRRVSYPERERWTYQNDTAEANSDGWEEEEPSGVN